MLTLLQNLIAHSKLNLDRLSLSDQNKQYLHSINAMKFSTFHTDPENKLLTIIINNPFVQKYIR